MSKNSKVYLEFSLPVSILREGKYFIAYTPALDLSTAGKTFEEAKKRFGEVVNIFFEELIDEGTLAEVLSELGWKKVNEEWSPPPVVFQDAEKFKVPISR